MKYFIFFVLVYFVNIYAQEKIDPQTNDSFTQATMNIDSTRFGFPNSIEMVREVEIIVTPKEASNASVSIIKTSQFFFNPMGSSTIPIEPDTLGTWNAPLLKSFLTGKYKLVINKEGFRDKTETILLNDRSKSSFTFELFSNAYLKDKCQQWKTTKWIISGIFAAAGIAAIIFKSWINSAHDEYNNAASIQEINNSRDKINSYQNSFKLSTGTAFIALGGFVFSQFMEYLYW